MRLEAVETSTGPAIGPTSDPTGDASVFHTRGYLDPVALLSPGQCRFLVDHFRLGEPETPAPWLKGHAVTDRVVYDIATTPRLLDLLRPLLGEDIVLWGASFVERRPGQVHHWHVDKESSAPDRRFASVWIGLRDTSAESGLSFVEGSHRFATPVQERHHAENGGQGEASDEEVLTWARALDPSAALVRPDVRDGDAVVFDGRIWHKSHNCRDTGARLALLLQYAEAAATIFMPDFSTRQKWPFKFNTTDRPPVIAVAGEGDAEANLVVPPPPTTPGDAPWITTETRPIRMPLADDPRSGWRKHPLFHGVGDKHDILTCHASVLSPGQSPHPPHSHAEEEILVVLDGEAELLIGDGPDPDAATIHPMRPGMFVYYPAYRHHSLRNAGERPLTYLMFKWRGTPIATDSVLGTTIIDPARHAPDRRLPYRNSLLFEGPTSYLGKLHAHVSEAEPGGGYDPHRDEHDVALVVLDGAIETLGRRVEPFGVVYYAGGELHGLRGKGPGTARYLVFEFHAADGEGATREKVMGVPPTLRNLPYRLGQGLLRRYPILSERIPRPVKEAVKWVVG
ncbi:MAG: cupin domain-containing protein [Azospirillaceae bacterium]